MTIGVAVTLMLVVLSLNTAGKVVLVWTVTGVAEVLRPDMTTGAGNEDSMTTRAGVAVLPCPENAVCVVQLE